MTTPNEINHTVAQSSAEGATLTGRLAALSMLWEREGNFLDTDKDDAADRAAGRAYKECAKGLRDAVAQPELNGDDVCGFCGQPGADKTPHPVSWPDENSAGTELVHAECEQEECARASALITGKRRDDFLRNCG